MGQGLKLLCIVAHPDDESIGLGGTLAKYSAEGVQTFVVTATRGECGRHGTTEIRPTPEALGRIREQEARAACSILGVQDTWFLGFPDGELDRVNPAEVVTAPAAHIRRIGPQVVITMPPGGCDGHPDHAVLSQLVTAAVVHAVKTGRAAANGDAPVLSKLYQLVMTRATWDQLRPVFAPTTFTVDGMSRDPVPWPDWAVTAELDTELYWKTVRSAVQCHRTQIEGLEELARLDDEGHRALWGVQRFYRAFSLTGGGRERETDLFVDLRGQPA